MKHTIKLIVLCILSLFLLIGCSDKNLIEQRENNAGKADGIIIGVPVPLEFAMENTNFLNGIELALHDINTEGINGKMVKLEIADDRGNFKAAVDIAQKFCKDTGMVAVIGHWFSDICIPVSSIYEDAGMLAIVPTVSNPELTKKGYKYVFQNIISDKRIAEEMCSYAVSKGYKRVVICYEEGSYGENMAYAIEKEAGQTGIKIIDRSSGSVNEEQFKKSLDKWKALEFDAVLLALNMPEGGEFIKLLRKYNQEAGIISADGLDVGNFIDVLGKDAEGVVIATTYSPSNNRPELVQFIEKYMKKYGSEPDVWAIQGYESLQLVAYAMKQTKSFSPELLAGYLRGMEPWQAVSGNIEFNEYGELDGREIYKKIVAGGRFIYVD